jgi:hypothetical protein
MRPPCRFKRTYFPLGEAFGFSFLGLRFSFWLL